MESMVAELALIHMLYARAELNLSTEDAGAGERAREHINEAIGIMEMLAPPRGANAMPSALGDIEQAGE